LLLGLVIGFDDKGLRMSNEALGKILGVLPSRITELFSDLESKGYIEIKNRKSRYRTIYFRPNPKVAGVLLSTKSESKKVLLSTLNGSTFDQSRNITKESNKRAHKTKKPMCDESFQKFWSAYPKKVAKVEAQKAWSKLKPTEELVERIIAAVKRQKQTRQWLKDNGQFIPNPTTWLNQKRWEDELPDNEFPTHDATEEEVEKLIREGVLPR
jgi:DNA-binding MarR family transcriptional regulator